ncbi:MAG TPA: sulfotransferase [Pyrinomonadaceae bacterium]|nr:sulfotransferase [Pyrinomonadaceae bacterium]
MSIHHQLRMTPPIFILSDVRSGSTLLRYILDTHPKICSPAELYLGQLCQNLYWAVYYSLGQTYTVSTNEERELLALAEVRRIVSEMMNSYAIAKNKQMWCEKSPPNLLYLDTLKGVFPDGKYICLYRNCMDVVHSTLEAQKFGYGPMLAKYIHREPENFVAALIEGWTDRITSQLNFERNNARSCFRIKYESLVYDPAETLEALFAFLGVEWNPAILETVFSTKHDVGNGDMKTAYSENIAQSSIGKGSNLSRANIPPHIVDRMNQILAELDYPVVGPDWDTSPSPYIKHHHDATKRKPLETTQKTSSIEEVFTTYVPRRIAERKDKLHDINAICKFVVSGNDSGVWRVDLTGNGNSVTASDGNAHCTVMILDRDLLGLVSGKVNPGEAYMQGKVRIEGDPDLVMRIGQVLFSPN